MEAIRGPDPLTLRMTSTEASTDFHRFRPLNELCPASSHPSHRRWNEYNVVQRIALGAFCSEKYACTILPNFDLPRDQQSTALRISLPGLINWMCDFGRQLSDMTKLSVTMSNSPRRPASISLGELRLRLFLNLTNALQQLPDSGSR